MFDEGEYSSTVADAECFTSFNILPKKKSINKKRFSDDQIRSLEIMFESESKLEPRKKLQVARELGLQPRQVAIWFQNKRARWKSKQLEQDYSILRANYSTLTSQFEALKKEKQSLVIQLQKLHDLMDKSGEDSKCCTQELATNSTDGNSNSGDNINSEIEVKPSLSIGSEHGIGVLSDDDSSIKPDYLGLDEEPDLLNIVEPADGSLSSPEDWGRHQSNSLLDDQSTGSYQWWDVWS